MTTSDLEGLRNELLNLERALRALAEEAERNQWMRLAANIEFAADRIERAIGILNDRLFANVRLEISNEVKSVTCPERKMQ